LTDAERLYQDNLQLGKIEYQLHHVHLRARPRALGLVLSNRCNLRCIHCYQVKNDDSLFAPAEIGRELRRELAGFYPYLSMLDLLGGEVFLSPGFEELVEDVAAMVSRPILNISTNGTLFDEAWAERIVRTPFHTVTVSIDAATPETYRRLRCGGELATVLDGIRRIQKWKRKLGSEFPYLGSFFVIMRSNFREIPRYLDLMHQEGIGQVALETLRINHQNTARTPGLVKDEVVASKPEVTELHGLLRQSLRSGRRSLHAIRVSGLTTLFAAHGLDGSFLHEDGDGFYPESDNLRSDTGTFELCPNLWTTMFVTESGNVHLCFLAEPIGNLYETPLAEIWNSPRALANRSRLISGRYLAAACSEASCSWREGRTPARVDRNQFSLLLEEMKEISERAARLRPGEPTELPVLDSVRRLLSMREQSSLEWEALFKQLCEINSAVHERGRAYIDHLESELTAARQAYSQLLGQQNAPLVRIALKASQAFDRLGRRSS
jgi:MoaA/NifB/PqqE/SkfB family radical SAM enzyme